MILPTKGNKIKIMYLHKEKNISRVLVSVTNYKIVDN